MTSISRMLERVKALESGFDLTLRAVIIDNEAIIVDMNAEDQLFEKGQNRLGVDISDYQPYSPITIEYKSMKGEPYDRVTLRDEGDFEASFFIYATADQFEIKAGDWKTEDLTRKYGDEILGLSDPNLDELIWQYIFPALIKYIREKLLSNE